MFAYFSKKIAASNQSKALCCFEWNQENGWVACGGKSSLLKVFKLVNDKSSSSSHDASSSLSFDVSVPFHPSFHQTLKGHSGKVTCLAWNSMYDKLASSDENGLIVIWALNDDDNKWYEEMVNNGNNSLVSDMKWACDGKKVCIAYENGAVIVGSVDGTRLWENKLDGVPSFRFIEWSPLGESIFLITSSLNEVKVLNSSGKHVKNISVFCHENKKKHEKALEENIHVVSVHWHHGNKILALAFSNGYLQLRRHLSDSSPIAVNSNLQISCCRWNPNGTVLAVCGPSDTSTSFTNSEEERINNMVKFYSPKGIQLCTLPIPQQSAAINAGVTSLSWERSSLRIAMAIGDSIYFANLRPDYEWAIFRSSTLVFADHQSNMHDNDNQVSIRFLKTKTNERREKFVYNKIVRSIIAVGDICAIVLEETKEDYQSLTLANEKYHVILCDECGLTIKEKKTVIEPVFTAISNDFFLLSDHETIYFWSYESSSNETTENNKLTDYEGYFHISNKDANPSQQKLIKKENIIAYLAGASSSSSSDKINFICVKSSCFLVSQMSGVINIYTLPPNDMLLLHALKLPEISQFHMFIDINCNNSKVAVIDDNDVLKIINIDQQNHESLKIGYDQLPNQQNQEKDYNKFQKKDVWKMKWSEDNPSSLVILEKSNLIIIHDLEDVESYHFEDGDSIPFGGDILEYKDFKVLAIKNLDEILSSSSIMSDENNSSNCNKVSIVELETKPLQNLRSIIKTQGLEEAISFLSRLEKKNSHQPQPWRYLAEIALHESNFCLAEKIYSQLKDIRGISFVKRLKEMFAINSNIGRQRAEIAVFLGRCEEAEDIFKHELGRNDLAMDLRMRLGDWSKVVDMAQSGGMSSGNDCIIQQSLENIGDDFADRRCWNKSSSYYMQAKCYAKALDAYLCNKNVQALHKIATEALINQDEKTFLVEKFTIGQMFESLGDYENAIKSYVNEDKIKNAIEICIDLSKWDEAAAIIEGNKNAAVLNQTIESLLNSKIKDCLLRGNKFQALELYRISKNRSSEASNMLLELAEDALKNQKILEAKKMYILYALEVDKQREKNIAEFNLHAASRNKHVSNIKKKGFLAYETFESLMNTSTKSTIAAKGSNRRINKIQENAWNGASAYHFFLLTHLQFYNHDIDAAMKTAIKCLEYVDDILHKQKEEVLSLVAISSFRNEYYNVCSRALFRLETLEQLQEKKRRAYRNLAQSIFTEFQPIDRTPALDPFYNFLLDNNNNNLEGNPLFCIVTGELIPDDYDQEVVIQCARCHHSMYKKELLSLTQNNRSCPLCRANVGV